MKRWMRWSLWIAAAIVLGIFMRQRVLGAARVAGTSMEPTLAPNDIVLVTKFSYWFSAPERGDIVLCYLPDRESTYLKRIIAVPGDAFSIKDGVSYLNGEQLTETYAVNNASSSDYSVALGADEYLVLGDNRPESYDSRASDVGLLSRKDFIGRARMVVWPFDRFRGLD